MTITLYNLTSKAGASSSSKKGAAAVTGVEWRYVVGAGVAAFAMGVAL